MQCPQCGGELVQRNGRKGPFWGCSNYVNGCQFTSSMGPQTAQATPYRGMNPAPPYQPSRTAPTIGYPDAPQAARPFDEFTTDEHLIDRFAPNLLYVLRNFKLIISDVDEFQAETLYDMLNLLNNKYPNDREILKLFDVARSAMQARDSRRDTPQPDPTPAPVMPTRKGRRSK